MDFLKSKYSKIREQILTYQPQNSNRGREFVQDGQKVETKLPN
jgi:hypothetical protein